MIWNGEFIAKAYVNCVIIWHSRVLLYVFSVFVTAVHGMLGAPSSVHLMTMMETATKNVIICITFACRQLWMTTSRQSELLCTIDRI